MKKTFLPVILILFSMSVILSGCGYFIPQTSNLSNHVTSVELSKKNFKVVAYVKGEAAATYIFGFGGLKKKALVEKARSEMMKNSDLVGTSRAIINETVEVHLANFLVVQKVRVVCSAYIVEFTE